MLRFNCVSKHYGKKVGVEALSFQLSEGEILAVVGTNGSGKTTTFRLLLGLLSPDKGSIEITDNKRNQFGYLPEERSLLKELTVFEHISYLGRLKQMKHEEIELSYQKWEKILKIKEYRKRRIKELSKGNQQKVQLLCCLIHNPKIMILDEPFTGLDQDNIYLFKRIIQHLKSEGKIILLSSHQYDHIEDFSDKVLVLYQGIEKYFGTIQALKERYRKYYITMNLEDYRKGKTERLKEYQLLGRKIKLLVEEEEYARKYAIWKLYNGQVNYLKFEDACLVDVIKELTLHD